MKIAAKIKKILRLVNKVYGKPPPFKKTPPVDELIRTILSQNTSDTNSLKAFSVLKRNFSSWDGLLNSNTRKVAGLIRHAGLANIKAGRIREALARIRTREGKIDLSSIGRMDTQEALEYLTSLKGVGPKTAACVLLFSFGKGVMPVDTHIYRVSGRLGIIDDTIDIGVAHERLTKIVPKHLIYNFHLGIIEHGRRTCKARDPKCGICVLYGLCGYGLKRVHRDRG